MRARTAPVPVRNDASTTHFAFLSESRIVELGTPKMAHEQTNAVVDYYEEFALHREDSTQKILKDLKKVQRQWRTLGVRSGREGEEANEKLRLIEKALQVFQSDESRHTYDESLKQVPKAIKSEKKTDWINESWKYYFVGDNGPAKIAATKARSAENDNPQCYVVSAWVELAEAWGSDREKRQTYRQAKKYADESYVLDLEKKYVADVNFARGVCFAAIKQHANAIECFLRALQEANPFAFCDIAWRAAISYTILKEYDKAVDICLIALKVGAEIEDDILLHKVYQSCYTALEAKCLHFHFGVDEITRAYEEKRLKESDVVNSLNDFRSMRNHIINQNIRSHLLSKLSSFIEAHIGRLELIEQRITAIKNAPSDELANTDHLKPGEPPSVNILLWSLGIAAIIGIVAYSSGESTLYTGLVFPLIGVLGYFTVLQNHDQDTAKYEKVCREAGAAQKEARAAQGRARSLGAVEIKVFEDQLREMKADIESN